jgi:hypothetical protein
MTALELIKKGWTQGVCARDKKGDEVNSGSAKAVTWCAIGALCRCYGGDEAKYVAARRKLFAVIRTHNISKWNDVRKRTHAEVIAAFEKAGI